MNGVLVSAADGAVDRDGFMELVEPVLPSAYRLAAGLLGLPSAAEDAVQDAVFNAWRHFGKFRRGSDLRPWLLTIVANECRRQQRGRWWSVVKSDRLPERPADAARDDERTDLRRALYQLPHDQRVAVVLRYYVGLSFEETGRTLGISTKAAKSRTYRALERLRLSPEVARDE